MKKFKIDLSFLILIFIIIFSPKQILIFKILLCLFIHELGHIFFIIIFKYKIKKLKLSIFGFFLEIENKKNVFYEDLLLYLGGILFNFLLMIIYKDTMIFKICMLLILFNIIPIYPLDGFNILKSILSYFIPYKFVLNLLSIISLLLNTIIIIFIIYFKLDLFIIINFLYLFYLSTLFYFNIQKIYQKFYLEKILYKYKYKNKIIKFHQNYKNYLYKYHTIIMNIDNFSINEEKILK